MAQCEFCGANLPADVSFCGKCGHMPRQATQISDAFTLQFEQKPDELPTMRLESNWNEHEARLLLASRPLEDMPTSPLHVVNLVPLENNQEDEEKRRKAALLGLGLLLPAEVAGEPFPGHLSSAPGTPQIAQVPSLQGTPHIQQPAPVSGSASAPAPGTPALPNTGAPTIAPPQPDPPFSAPATTPLPPSLPQTPHPAGPGSPGPHPGGSGSPGPSSGGKSGCLVTLIVVITTLLLILASIISLGLTVWAPGLSLNGNSSVLPGSTLSLHGSSFLPNTSVTLTLDNNIPIYYLQRSVPGQGAKTNLPAPDNAAYLLQPSARGNNVLTAQSNGTFAVSFLVEPSWAPGRHTIHASETLTHRGASLTFTIMQLANATATPSSTQSTTPISGVTPTATSRTATTPTPIPAVTSSPTTRVTPTPTPKPTSTTSPPTPTPVPPSPTPTPPPPLISANPVSVNSDFNPPCVYIYNSAGVITNSQCAITLTNNSSNVPLTWSATSSASGVTIQASSYTIAAGSTEQVAIVVPYNNTTICGTPITITFSGPANSAVVSWDCNGT